MLNKKNNYKNKKNRIFGVILLALSILRQEVNSQQLPDRKKNADRLYYSGNYGLAIPIYKALLIKQDLDNPYLPAENINFLADCYRLTKRYNEAEHWYRAAIMNLRSPNLAHFYYGESLQLNGKYKEAMAQFLVFKPKNNQDSILKSIKIESCQKSLSLKSIRSHYQVKNLKEINSKLSDFGIIENHGDFIFVSNRGVKNISGSRKSNDSIYGWTNEPFWRLYSTRLSNHNSFEKPELLSKTINSKYHTGPAVLNQKGDVIFFTQSNAQRGKQKINSGSLHFKENISNNQILVSVKENETWQKPISCTFNNVNSYSVEHPALSKDEKILYFSSNMPGGKGGMDLYSVDILGGGMFGIPKNLGDSINSPGDEVFPTVSKDGSLYYSSNGKVGFGGLDIFHGVQKSGKWSKSINLGKPINSDKDDFIMIFIDSSGHKGFFSSNRDGGMGEDDIYSFSESSHQSELDSLSKLSYTYLRKTNPKILDTLHFFFKIDSNNSWVGKKMILHSLYYQIGKATIKTPSLAILNQIAVYLSKNEKLRLLISGFTDNKGLPSKNLLLSAARANNIRDYLISKGVDPNRLEAEGFGSTMPLVRCPVHEMCTQKQNQLNRRTEFVLVL